MHQKLKFDNLFSDRIYEILEMAFRLCTSKSVTYSTEWNKPHLILNRSSFQMFILGHWKCKFAIWYCKYLCSIQCYFYHVFWHIFKFFLSLIWGVFRDCWSSNIAWSRYSAVLTIVLNETTLHSTARPFKDAGKSSDLQKSVYAHSNSKHWNNFWWHKLS